MSHTHLLYHIIYGTKNRLPLVSESWESEFYKQMGGIVRNHHGVAIEINGMPDHLHLLVRLKPVIAGAAFFASDKVDLIGMDSSRARTKVPMATSIRSVLG